MSMSLKKLMTKKVVVIGAAVTLTLGLSGAAFAFFTNNSTGTGSASVGTQSSWTFQVSPAANGPMFPEAIGSLTTAETVAYTVTNNGGVTQHLTSVDVKVDPSFTHTDAGGDPACNASDFSVGGSAVGVTNNSTSAAGDYASGAVTSTQSVTVELVENTFNQNSCEGVTVPLIFKAN